MKYVYGILLFLSFCFMITLTSCGFGGGSEGYHRGHITDVSLSGWLCKTYEGQIQTGTGQSAIKYEFTITSLDAFNKLKTAQADGHEVNVHYFSPVFFWACSSSHSNYVDGVKTLSGAGLSGGGTSGVLDTN